MIDNESSGKVLRFKTWVPQEIGGSMIEEAVRASDYDALLQQLDALELSRRSWMDEAKSLEKRFSGSEPEAYMYQHEETGIIGFVDIQQVEWGFEKNNPRLKIICPLYRHPPATMEMDISAQLESLAKQIYQSWESQPGFHPWVEGGNSAKQEEARQIASRTFELALANQIDQQK